MNFVGKICPYCKTEFKEGDDVVVCSICEMPHHKDCWIENQGCTTFGCLGTINVAGNGASSVTATQMNFEDPRSTAPAGISGFVFCTKCGTQNEDAFSFCRQCGNKLEKFTPAAPQPPVYTQANPANPNPYANVSQPAAPYQQPNNYQPNYQAAPYQQPNNYQPNYQAAPNNAYQSAYQTPDVDPAVRHLIGPKTEYYVPRFQKIKAEGNIASWNWAAFLVAPFWLMYRKMYGFAAAALAVDVVISIIGSNLLSLVSLGGYIVFGILGNSIYMHYLENKAKQANSMGEQQRCYFLAANSGVNVLATVLSAVGRVILGIILLS